MKKKYYLKPDVQIIRAFEPDSLMGTHSFPDADAKRRPSINDIDAEAFQPRKFNYEKFEPWADYKEDK